MDDYIHFIMKGDKVIHRWWKDIAEITKKLGFKKILVEVFVFIEPSFQEIREMATDLENIGFKAIKLAYLDNNPDLKSVNELALAIVKIWGIEAEVFNDKEQAIAWLKQTTKP